MSRDTLHRWTLPNGLDVLFLEDHHAPVATVQVWIRAGSRDEAEPLQGLAHLMEHLMFRGSRNVPPEDHARRIQAVGGSSNAFTSDDITVYHQTLPASAARLALELEADRLHLLSLEEATFGPEKEVVKEEFRMLQNNPVSWSYLEFRRFAFRVHPYRWTPAGSLESLDRITLEDARAFYRRFYHPANAVLVVAGDLDPAVLRQDVDDLFGPLEGRPAPRDPVPEEPAETESRRGRITVPLEIPLLALGAKVPPASHPDTEALDVLNQVLGQGQSSRLHRSLVRRQELAVLATGFGELKLDPGLHVFIAAYLPGTPEAALERAMRQELDRVCQSPLPADELDKARRQLTANFVFEQYEVEEKALALGHAALIEGDVGRYFSTLDRFAAVDAQSVLDAARRHLAPDRLLQAVMRPARLNPAVALAGWARRAGHLIAGLGRRRPESAA